MGLFDVSSEVEVVLRCSVVVVVLALTAAQQPWLQPVGDEAHWPIVWT